MKAHKLIKHLVTSALALALGITFMASKAVAVPYASQVTKSGDIVSFVLNQNAQLVEVVLNPGGAKLTLGTTAGDKSFNMAGYTSYQIIVSNNVAKSWQQYVADGVDRNFYTPIGVSIDKNPASPNFGKVFVSNARPPRPGPAAIPPKGSMCCERTVQLSVSELAALLGAARSARARALSARMATFTSPTFPWISVTR